MSSFHYVYLILILSLYKAVIMRYSIFGSSGSGESQCKLQNKHCLTRLYEFRLLSLVLSPHSFEA